MYYCSTKNRDCCLKLYQNKNVYMFFNLYIYRMLEYSNQFNDTKKFYDNLSNSVSSKYPNDENKQFPSLELIPNKLTTNPSPRSMSIHKFSIAKRATLRDFISYHLKDKTPIRILIHTISVPIKLRANRIDYNIPPIQRKK